MISHKHKCIFVHVPKAAGTSIERAFMEDLGLDMDNRHALLLGASTNIHIGPRRISHLTAMQMLDQHYISEELYDEYFKFSFVREPKSRLFSTYKFLKFNEVMSFDNFIITKLDDLLSDAKFDFFLKPAYDYIYNKKGDCLVDFVGKFENLETDFKQVQAKINFLNSDGALKHHNKTVSDDKSFIQSIAKKLKNYKTSYKDINSTELGNEATIKIQEYYKNDYEFFGY